MNAGVVALSHSGNVRLPEPDENVTIRFRASGMLHIVGRNGGRKLKKIWQEQNVPPWRRDTTPLLFYGDTLIAAAGGSSLKRVAEAGVNFEWKRNGQPGCPLVIRIRSPRRCRFPDG